METNREGKDKDPSLEAPVDVLLVDDRADNLLVMAAILRSRGYRLTRATSGHEALRALAKATFAVVLLDVQMPGLDGFETARLIRASDRSCYTPIIFITALYPDKATVARAYELGAVDYLTKPINAPVLRGKVAVFAELYRARRKEMSESESRFQRMADSAPVLIWTAGEHRGWDWVNQQWLDFTGIASEGSLGFDWLGRVHPEDLAGCLARYSEAFESRAPFVWEFRLKRRDGAYRWVAGNGVPRWKGRSEFAGYVGSLIDITERKRAELAVRESEAMHRREAERQRFLAEAGALLGSTLDCERTLKQVARLIEQRLGAGCRIELRSDDESLRVAAESGVLPVIASAGPSSPDVALRAVSAEVALTGRSRRLPSATIVPLGNGAEARGALTLVGDPGFEFAGELARRLTMAIERSRHFESAQRAILLRDEFLSIASHELNTPITSLLLQMQATRRVIRKSGGAPLAPEQLDRLLGVSERQLARLTTLVRQLLDVSRVHSGKLEYDFGVVDVGELVAGVAGEMREQFVRARIPLELDLPPRVVAWGDRHKLEQVVEHLLSNALKFSEGKPVRVSVGASQSGASISVVDRGMGIALDKQERIFEKFERAVPSSRISGLGLGLYLAREIVKAHGGRVAVESRPGQGARFTVELPMPEAQAA